MPNPVSYELLADKGLINTNAGITPDGGFCIWLTNKTGNLSKKGNVVISAYSFDKAFELASADSISPMGVIYDDNVPDGGLCRIVVSGMAYALLKDGLDAYSGYWAGVSDTPGRIYTRIDPPSTTDHSREVGHCLETITSGTDKLVLLAVHFN